MCDELELYLLSKMSATELVDSALEQLGLSRGQMRSTAARVGRNLRLDDPMHFADVYEQLAGPASTERPLSLQETTEVFAGSIRRYYSLPLWPEVQFVVNRDTSGYAWGETFVQRGRQDLCEEIFDFTKRVCPWEFASDAILGRATDVEILDNWTDFLIVRASFRSATGSAVLFRAHFDLGLLQIWKREG